METKLYRGGAPKKEASERKDRIVRVMFNDAEFTRLKQRKESTKSANLSHFIRTVCLDKPLRVKPQLSTHQENVLSLVREMRTDVLRIGVNINQSVKRINSTTDYHDLQKDVNQMSSQLIQLDAQLRAIMGALLQPNSETTLNPVHADGSTN